MLLIMSMSLVVFKAVKVKMLPFDNKNEFQVLLDYPTDKTLAQSLATSKELAEEMLAFSEIQKVQIFAGEAAPYSFSGMVKHTFLRKEDNLVDVHVVLSDKSSRKRSSHEVIHALRSTITRFSQKHGVVSKVLEIPPGPPVMATMVAEVYAPDRQTQLEATKKVRVAFSKMPGVVDLDDSTRPERSRLIYPYSFHSGGQFGTSAAQMAQVGRLIFSETPLLTMNDARSPESVDVVLSVDPESRSGTFPFRHQQVRTFSGAIDADQVLGAPVEREQNVLYRKNLRPVSYVTAELSGDEEAPVYAIWGVAMPYATTTLDIPWPIHDTVVKWDGEWFITYEVFRDLGAAFVVVIVLIYILILGWFKRFLLPLVIMAPIPISLIGILPGHWITGSYFTATSMIGFIAGAGIIVRNSIILVDFIEHQVAKEIPLKEAVISAGVIRFRPMLLTAGAVVVGSLVMLADPIFQGLAVSLMFGEMAATLLSRFAVPLFYYWQATGSKGQ